MSHIHPQWEKAVDRWIDEHREEMIRDIVTLVRIRSVPVKTEDEEMPLGEACRVVLDTMLDMGERFGFAVKNYGNRVGRIDMERPGSLIGLWGHLDVVPEGDGWIYPPYEGIVQNDIIIGRGSQDNKGQAVAALYVMRCIRELDIPLRHNLALYVGTEEESGMSDMDWFLAHETEPPFSIVPDSSYPVCYGEKGMISAVLRSKDPLSAEILDAQAGVADNMVPDSAWILLAKSEKNDRAVRMLPDPITVTQEANGWKLTAKGIAAHAASPQGGVNAIAVLLQALLECGTICGADARQLRFLYEISNDCFGAGLGIACEDDISGRLTCTAARMWMEDGRLAVRVNIRHPVHAVSEELVRHMEEACNRNGFILQPVRVSPSHYFPPDAPVSRILTETYNEITGDNKEPFVLGGGTYARKLKRALSFGMGFGGDMWNYKDVRQRFPQGHGDAHAPDEFTIIEHLLISIKIYVHGLLAIDHMDTF